MAFHGVMGVVWVVEYWVHRNVLPLGLKLGSGDVMLRFSLDAISKHVMRSDHDWLAVIWCSWIASDL